MHFLLPPEPCTEAGSLRDRQMNSQERRSSGNLDSVSPDMDGHPMAGWWDHPHRRQLIPGSCREEDFNPTSGSASQVSELAHKGKGCPRGSALCAVKPVGTARTRATTEISGLGTRDLPPSGAAQDMHVQSVPSNARGSRHLVPLSGLPLPRGRLPVCRAALP